MTSISLASEYSLFYSYETHNFRLNTLRILYYMKKAAKPIAFALVILSAFLFLHHASQINIHALYPPANAATAPSPLAEEDPEKVHVATALLHETGTPPEVNLRTWRLKVKGAGVERPLRLSYDTLLAMERVDRNVILICPGAFTDRADWEGVPLTSVMKKAGVSDDYETVMVVGLDGFSGMFSREEVDGHLIFLALKVNGVTLPREHGFPVRIVAEDILGGKWVKCIDYIEIY